MSARAKFMFKNRKITEKKVVAISDVTVEQQKKFIDAYVLTSNRTELKKILMSVFDGDFRNVIDTGIKLMNTGETVCSNLMTSENPPTTLTELRKMVNDFAPEENNEVVNYLVGKIVAATGTFKEYQKTFVDEVVRIGKNIVWTFPMPFDSNGEPAFTFNDDPGHNEVIVDMQSYEKDFQVFNESTKTAKGIWIFARPDRKIELTMSGIIQEGYSEDTLPWKMINYKKVWDYFPMLKKFL